MAGWTRWWVVGLLVGCGTIIRPPDPDRRLKVTTAGSLFETDRGYRIATLPEEGSDVIWLDVRYPVGSAQDPPGKAGLAHLVEHLLFDVEIARGGRKTSIGAELGRLALSWNAETTEEHTTYHTLIDPGALDEVLGLEVDRISVGCAGLTQEIFLREREVVMNELRTRQGAGGAAIARVLHDAAYPEGHPYRPVDSVESIGKLELADACAFLAGPYRRGPALVVASGAVDRAQMQRAAAHQLQRLRPRDPAPAAPSRVVDPRPGKTRERVDIEEPTLIALWPLPPRDTHEYRMLELAWPTIPARLGGFAFGYKWGHSTSARILGGARGPVLAVSVTLTSASKAGEAIEAVEKSVAFALRMLTIDGETREAPAWRIRWQGRAEALLAGWESLSERAEAFADFLQFETGTDYLVGRIRELSTAEPPHAHRLADLWLDPSRARFIVLEPSGVSAARGAATYAGGAAAHGTRVDPASADRPLVLPPSARTPLQIERYRLGNGLSVVLWPHGKAPLVRGRLVVDSGWAHDPSGKEGIADLVGSNAAADHIVFGSRELSTRMDDLVHSLTLELRYPGTELSDDAKTFLRGRLRQQRAKERRTYTHDLMVALYGSGHPYARPPMTEDSLDEIHRDLVMSWARDHVVAKNSTLIIAGRFDPALVRRYIAFHADQVPGGGDSPDLDLPPRPRQAWISGITGKPSPTVDLDVGFVAGRSINANHAKRLVLEAVLDEKLSELRGKRALAYSFSASYTPRRAGGMWWLSGSVDASRAGEAGELLVQILDELRRDPSSYRAAFVLARQKVLQRLLVNAGSTVEVLDRLVDLVRFDLPDDTYARITDEVAGLTIGAFQGFVERELAETGQVFGAFGNGDAVQAALDAAKRAAAAAHAR